VHAECISNLLVAVLPGRVRGGDRGVALIASGHELR